MLIPLLVWVLTIFNNGTPVISMSTTLTGGFANLTLPATPQSYVLLYVNDTPMPYILNNTYIIIPVFGTANVTITYIPRVYIINGFIGINITTNDVVKVIVPSDALIYNITLSIMNMSMVNKELVLLTRGPGTILYTVMTKPATSAVMGKPSPLGPYQGLFLAMVIILITVVVSSIMVLVLRRRGGRGGLGITYGLSDHELSIIRYIESRGGSAFEGDISRDLGIPRTTVWRIVRRLEDLGIVEVRKVGGKNLVIIRRRPMV
ncbi:MAG: winged helix-turn-helix transcriptional regulator [Vulcanisaeta sp.]|nr:winged helix-turn-helix transcriptional regulator [Vulcanisaeta sp.]